MSPSPHRTSQCLPGAALRSAALSVALLIVGAAFTAAAQAAPVAYGGSSEDGGKVFFTTSAKLVPGDTDNHTDVYERFFDTQVGIETFVTRELSTGPTGGNDAGRDDSGPDG